MPASAWPTAACYGPDRTQYSGHLSGGQTSFCCSPRCSASEWPWTGKESSGLSFWTSRPEVPKWSGLVLLLLLAIPYARPRAHADLQRSGLWGRNYGNCAAAGTRFIVHPREPGSSSFAGRPERVSVEPAAIWLHARTNRAAATKNSAITATKITSFT